MSWTFLNHHFYPAHIFPNIFLHEKPVHTTQICLNLETYDLVDFLFVYYNPSIEIIECFYQIATGYIMASNEALTDSPIV